MRYSITFDAGDGPIWTDNVKSVLDIGLKIENFLKLSERQGYFLNCRQERIPLDEITFTLTPCTNEGPTENEN